MSNTITSESSFVHDWNLCFAMPTEANCSAFARKWMQWEVRQSDGMCYADIDPKDAAAGFHKARVVMHRDPVQRNLSNRWLQINGYSFGEEVMGTGHEPT